MFYFNATIYYITQNHMILLMFLRQRGFKNIYTAFKITPLLFLPSI